VRRQALSMNTDAAVDLERAMGRLRPKRSALARKTNCEAEGGEGAGGADADGAARPIFALSFGRGSELRARRVPSGAGGKIR